MKNFICLLFLVVLLLPESSYSQYRPMSMKESVKLCKNAFKAKNYKNLENNCDIYKVRQLFVDLQKISGVYNFSSTHNSFFSCINNLQQRADYTRDDMPEVCSEYEFRNSLHTGQLNSCLSKVPSQLSSNDKWSICISPRTKNLVFRSSFSSCIDKSLQIGLNPNEAIYECEDTRFRAKIKTHNIISCMNNFPSADMFNFNQRINICGDHKLKNRLHTKEVAQCIPLLKSMGLNSHLLGVCVNRGYDIIKANQKELKACISKGINAGYGKYFNYETNRLNRDVQHNKNSYYYLTEDCLNREEDKEENEYFSYLQDINIHTDQPFKTDKSETQMYGLSAVRYSEDTESLIILSDSRHTPKLFEFKLSKVNSLYELRPESNFKLKAPKGKSDFFSSLDPEGLLLMSNGDILISSEQESKKKKLELILRYDSEGEIIDTIDVPGDFAQKTETIKEEHKDTFYYVQDNIRVDKKTGKQIAGSSYKTTQKPWNCKKPRCEYKRKTEKYTTSKIVTSQGMTYNKGLESLGMTEDENYIFSANESTLIQDEEEDSYRYDSEKNVRIIRYDNTTRKPTIEGQYLYTLEDEEDNGLVDILPISKNKILTLERSYDQFKKKITARIFLTDLSNASDVTGIKTIHDKKLGLVKTEKKELIDLDDILPEMSPGFRKLDNFEGMSFGPTLEDGSRTLVLVSDNNNSSAQRTIILLLKIKKPL